MIRQRVTVTTDSSGDATGYTEPVSGYVHAIRYTPDGSTPLDTNADVTVTAATTGLAILTVTNLGTAALNLYPRAATVSTAGAAALYAAGGTAVNDRIPVCDERITFTVAQGGNAKSGTFDVYLDQ